MSTTPATITERLHAQSDKQLAQHLAKAKHAFISAITIGKFSQYPDIMLEVDFPGMKGQKAKIQLDCVLSEISDQAFEAGRDTFRDRAVAEFMAKVDGLESQLQEIREAIPQQ